MPKPRLYRHLGFTGTKEGMTSSQALRLKDILRRRQEAGYLWMHNGSCVGADKTAADIWRGLRGKIILHPPVKTGFMATIQAEIVCEPKDYLARDRDIAECCELLIATPLTDDEQLRSGTWATVRYARLLRRRVYIVQRNGELKKE